MVEILKSMNANSTIDDIVHILSWVLSRSNLKIIRPHFTYDNLKLEIEKLRVKD